MSGDSYLEETRCSFGHGLRGGLLFFSGYGHTLGRRRDKGDEARGVVFS